MKSFIYLISLFLAIGSSQSNSQVVDFIQYDKENLAKIKSNLKTGQAKTVNREAYNELLLLADTMLSTPAPTVTNKKRMTPSKDQHDYLSLSRYWWPDPSQKDGLPWIRKDGQTNPLTQTDDVDRKRLGVMTGMASTLGLAYYFSGDEKYAQKASQVISVWFLDTDTRMNPNLAFAQSVPGNPKKRRSGILDGRVISQKVLDAITMISPSSHWNTQKNNQMNQWLTDYLTWLTTSELGKEGAQQTNNHGSWYNFQVTALAYYLGEDVLLEEMIEAVKQSYNFQFDNTGAQPHELQRTRSYFYSCFNLEAMTGVAIISEKIGKSIWLYTNKDGKSLSKAIDFLLPATQGEYWPHKTNGVQPMYIAPLLQRIQKHTDNPKYAALLNTILSDAKKVNSTTENIHTQKVLFDFALFHSEFLKN